MIMSKGLLRVQEKLWSRKAELGIYVLVGQQSLHHLRFISLMFPHALFVADKVLSFMHLYFLVVFG